MEIQTFPSREVAAEAAAALINNLLEQAAGKSVLLLLSGGSALKLADLIDVNLLPTDVTISVLDERFYPETEINNFSQLNQTRLMRYHKENNGAVIDTRVQPEDTLDSHAARFEEGLRRWMNENPGGEVLATFGMGADGHIAGVMPFPEDPAYFSRTFDAPERWVVGYDAEHRNQHRLRVTTTLSFLRSYINGGVVYVTGTEKKEALQRVKAEKGTLSETPARLIREIDSLVLCTDIQ